MKLTDNEIVNQMALINISGNIIPQQWYSTIVRENGKPYLEAIVILADIVYWYKPTEIRDEQTGQVIEYKTKFSKDILQRSYQQLADMFGISKREATNAIIHLEKMGIIKRVFRNLSINGIVCNNVLFIELIPEKVKEITYLSQAKYTPLTFKSDRSSIKKREVYTRSRDTNTNTLSEIIHIKEIYNKENFEKFSNINNTSYSTPADLEINTLNTTNSNNSNYTNLANIETNSNYTTNISSSSNNDNYINNNANNRNEYLNNNSNNKNNKLKKYETIEDIINSNKDRVIDNSYDSILNKKEKEDYINNDIFPKMWYFYPRKVSKEQARKTYIKKFKNAKTKNEIRLKAQNMLIVLKECVSQWKNENRESQFVPHMSSWLNQEFGDND